MSISSQVVNNAGETNAFTITCGDGSTITLTKAQIQTFFQGTSGSAASRRNQTIAFIRDQIGAALGRNIDPALLTINPDTATGGIAELRYGPGPAP